MIGQGVVNEAWVVVSGKGTVVFDGEMRKVQAGDMISMPAESKHTVIADTELKLIEVQLGKDLIVHDKQKFDLGY